VSLTSKLTTAAATLGSMPDAEISQRLHHLETTHRRRSPLERARRQAELDSLDLDWAAYQLASQHDHSGGLPAAARWYRMAAGNDFADAALRLGIVLEMLATQRAAVTGPGYYTAQREELALVSDAARWYAEAYGAGHPEAAERLDEMISNHDTRRPRPAPPPPPPSAEDSCRQGGLAAVINTSDLATASAHFRRCTSCQREFVGLNGLLPAPSARAAPGPWHDSSQDDPEGRSQQALAARRAG
jgi:hypothetical protein